MAMSRALQGWTMLGASCPVDDCYTPLMRNKQGKMFCVRCDQFVVTEEEARKQQEEEEAENEAIEAAMEAEAQAEAERTRRIEQQFRFEEQAKQAREMQELEQTKAERTTAINGAAKRKIDNVVDTTSSDSDAEVNVLRRQTLAALYQKMGALTDSLSPTDHSERLISVAKAVREIAKAAQLLTQ
ncbi:hypothetical protein V7S43_003677 [Phytophthora oleae]|uniref:Sjoegren syndrome/scleroderma autoantigen 1 n=1 Tax=Phytophthora oleae TaxID=2107226 RepID=A0ABD3FYE1_9STRA